jgi:hypothetical protein
MGSVYAARNGSGFLLATTFVVPTYSQEQTIHRRPDSSWRRSLIQKRCGASSGYDSLPTNRAKAARKSFESNRSVVSKAPPDTPNKDKILDAYRDKLVALTASEDFEDRVVDVYAKYLTDDDVKALTQFYESSAGQRFSSAETYMNSELGQAGVDLGREQIPGILEELCGQFVELQGKAKFCSTVQSKSPIPQSSTE